MANIVVPMSAATIPVNRPRGADRVEPGVSVLGAVALGCGPIADVAVDAHTVTLTHFGDQSVSLLDARALRQHRVIGVAGEPSAAVAADGHVYIGMSTASRDFVLVIDTRTRAVVARYAVASAVTTLAISPDRGRLYVGVTGQDGTDVAVIDLATGKQVCTVTIDRGSDRGVDAIAVDPTGERLFVAMTGSGASKIAVVDVTATRIVGNVGLEAPIRDVAVADGSAYVLTSDRRRGGSISVIDTSMNAITDVIALGGAPTQMILSPDQTRAYVVDYDYVAVVCTVAHRVVQTVAVDARPACVAAGMDGDSLLVADYSGRVSAFRISLSTPLCSHSTTAARRHEVQRATA